MKRRRMVRVVLALVVLGLAGLGALALTPLQTPHVQYATPRWVGPVHVVDVETGVIARDRALRLEQGRIVAVVEAAAVPQEERQGWVDAGGAYVVPGLWDMHAVPLRYAPALDLPLHLAHGVTRLRAVRSCPREGAMSRYACPSDRAAWNAQVQAGRLLGPLTMSGGSFPLDGPERRHPDVPELHRFTHPDQAQALVRLYRDGPLRVDHLETGDWLPRAHFFALVAAARRSGVEVSGHVPRAVTLREAAGAGLREVAQARVLPIACSAHEAAILELRSSNRPDGEWMPEVTATYDATRCAGLWQELKAKGTFLSPALLSRINETRAGLARLSAELDMGLVPPLVARQWEDASALHRTRSEKQEAVAEAFSQQAIARVRDAEAAGVRMLLGAETWEPYVLPGVGLHQEMRLWQEAGISPLAILRAATLNAAAYHGQKAHLGQVRAGFVADLVFTREDPLKELGTLRTPVMVMQEGRLYTRETLDEAVTGLRGIVHRWRLTVHMLRDFLQNPRGF